VSDIIEKTKKKIAVMQAFVDGEKIRCRDGRVGYDTGSVVSHPRWNWEHSIYEVAKLQPEVGKWYKTRSGRLVECQEVIIGPGQWRIKTAEFSEWWESDIQCEVTITEVPL
jgi:hypothetical protein